MPRVVQAFCPLVLAMSLAGCPGGGSNSGGSTAVAAACPKFQTHTSPGGPPAGTPPSGIPLRLEQIQVGLTFPVLLTAPPGDMDRLFVVEKGGVIKIICRANNTLSGTFLDISNLVSNGGEQGLLGLAFDPQYALNRRFYVSYTDRSGTGNSVIARYLTDPNNPNVAISGADQIVMTLVQPFTNHNGGMIAFGPTDSLLYIGFGDGGSGGDPDNRAQNINDLLGKMLRIDINTDDFPADPMRNYGIPASNPFVGIAGADEIWSTGLRNPWRFSFDRQTRDLYIGDVGQNLWEEVNASTSPNAGRGINYGWRIMEGMHCFNPAVCNPAGLTQPVIEYAHNPECSVTGGYAYRGAAIPALQGTYFYGDFCSGFVRSFRLAGGVATEPFDWMTLRPGGNVTSFGEDAEGNVYIVTQQGGVYRIVLN